MRPERFREVEAWFAKLADLRGPRRDAALADLSRQDPEIGLEVTALLQNDSREFLATPALGAPVEAFAPAVRAGEGPSNGEPVGQQIGPYRLIQRIASGGMGTVYLAERAGRDFTQQVAIKLVRRGLDSEEVLRRFREERRTLASMHHDGIARLIDGGQAPDGRPYLVMEFVEGVPIDDYCHEHALTLRRRIELFRWVCDAVQYAHQNLVIHRDLKPQNVLVTPGGVPKLVDFGVAKMLGPRDDEGITLDVGSRFTPEYASPEQALGEPVTTASDIYSLGVLLYQLVAARPPYDFKERTTTEFRRVICEVEPLAPGSPDADLDRIVLMAMAKEPSRRYASAEQLSADLRRYLAGQPVLARPATIGYLTRKFVRRHRVGVAASGLIGLSLLAGAGGIAWQVRVASRERDLAFSAREQSEQINRFLQEMLAEADPSNRGASVTMGEVLDAAAVRARAELAARPAVLAAILATIGRTYLGLGLYDKAEPQLLDALRAREALSSLGDVADSLGDLATLRYSQGRSPEAEPLLRRALTLVESSFDPRDPRAAMILNSLGPVLRAQGRPDEAQAHLARALEIRRAADADSLGVAETLNNLGAVARDRKDFAGAESLLADSLAIRRRHLAPDHPLLTQSLDNLAVILHSQGKLDQAEPLYREALEKSRGRLGPDHPDLAITMNNLGTLETARSRPAAAEALFREVVRIRGLTYGPADSRTVMAHANLGAALGAQKRFEEAESVFLEGLSQSDSTTGEAATRVLKSRMAQLYTSWGKPEKAAQYQAPLAPSAAPSKTPG